MVRKSPAIYVSIVLPGIIPQHICHLTLAATLAWFHEKTSPNRHLTFHYMTQMVPKQLLIILNPIFESIVKKKKLM